MVTDEEIYYYLLGDVKIPEVYNSPLPTKYRQKDDTPSFGLYEHNGRICWKDFGLANPWGNKAINLVAYMRELPLETPEQQTASYRKAMHIINTEIANGVLGKSVVLQKNIRSGEGNLPYLTWNKHFTDFELDYWSRYQITEEDLHREWIYGLKALEWNNSSSKTISTPNNPAFVYIFRYEPLSWKLYRPLHSDKKQKFRQWNISEIVEGGHLFGDETFDLGIICSSTKERIVGKKALSGESVIFINPTGEGTYFALISLWSKIKHYAKRWIIIFDCDEAGFKCGEVLASHLNIQNIDMRGKLAGQKDLSDFIDSKKGKHSYKELNTILKSLT